MDTKLRGTKLRILYCNLEHGNQLGRRIVSAPNSIHQMCMVILQQAPYSAKRHSKMNLRSKNGCQFFPLMLVCVERRDGKINLRRDAVGKISFFFLCSDS